MNFIKSSLLTLLTMLFSTSFAFTQDTANNQNADSLITSTVKVKGITCSMDLKMISANVESLQGVRKCNVGKQGTSTTFEITYNPAFVKETEIYAAIENTGSCENPDERPYKVKQ
jgi:L,D-peptidoglycan transpeptidase YkuD (ErfK/YbiS/YcfS/YnhG family)